MAEEQNPPLDANNRLKQRMRATVPPRDTSILKRLPLDATPSPPKQQEIAVQSDLPKQTKATEKEQKLVAFTLRVENSIDKGLKSLCTQEGITKETFLEAAYLVCLDNEQLMQQVLEIAQERRQERRETGIVRRAQSMTRYLQET
ncbi:hypothetical protein BCD67_00305 [Oscillatoriales cyanobacterium USR001]|nr:hypothetical protein BCD67_00305 [Oscillatoriales cyanobacterium USR001]